MEAEQTLISNLYLCLGERGQNELHNRKPHLGLATTRYPRVLDEFESVFRKERNEMFETYQLLSGPETGKKKSVEFKKNIEQTREKHEKNNRNFKEKNECCCKTTN